MLCSFGLPTMQNILITKLVGVQRKAPMLIPSLRNESEEERLSHLNLFSLARHRLRGKLMKCFKMLNGFMNVDPIKLFVMDDSTETRKWR